MFRSRMVYNYKTNCRADIYIMTADKPFHIITIIIRVLQICKMLSIIYNILNEYKMLFFYTILLSIITP